MSTAVAPLKDMEVEAASVANALAKRAASLIVTNQPSAERAAAFLRDLVARKRQVEQWFKPLVDAAFAAHRALTQRRADTLAKFNGPEATVRTKLEAYQTEAERKRREAVAAAERQGRETAERQRAEKANAAMDRGEFAKGDAIMAAPPPLVVLPPIAAPVPEKLDRVSFVDQWKFEVIDEAAVPREYCTIDPAKIRKVVSALGAAAAIPGVRTWVEKATRVS